MRGSGIPLAGIIHGLSTRPLTPCRTGYSTLVGRVTPVCVVAPFNNR